MRLHYYWRALNTSQIPDPIRHQLRKIEIPILALWWSSSHYHGGSWMTQFWGKKSQIDHRLRWPWWMPTRADDEWSINTSGAGGDNWSHQVSQPGLHWTILHWSWLLNSRTSSKQPGPEQTRAEHSNITNTTRLITAHCNDHNHWPGCLKYGEILCIWSRVRLEWVIFIDCNYFAPRKTLIGIVLLPAYPGSEPR